MLLASVPASPQGLLLEVECLRPGPDSHRSKAKRIKASSSKARDIADEQGLTDTFLSRDGNSLLKVARIKGKDSVQAHRTKRCLQTLQTERTAVSLWPLCFTGCTHCRLAEYE